MSRYNFLQRASHLYNICSDDDFRPVMNCIFFEENNAIATDGHVMIVIPISEISNLNDEDIEKLKGKLINKITFKNLLRYPYITKIEEDGIWAKDRTGYCEVKFKFAESGRYPNYKSVFGAKQRRVGKEISFRSYFLGELCEIVGDDMPRLTPNAGYPILVRWKKSKTRALIMPILVPEDEIEDKDKH